MWNKQAVVLTCLMTIVLMVVVVPLKATQTDRVVVEYLDLTDNIERDIDTLDLKLVNALYVGKFDVNSQCVVEPKEEGSFLDRSGKRRVLEKVHRVKQTYPHLKLFMSVGGEREVANLRKCSSEHHTRKVVVESLHHYTKYGFDGVNYFWKQNSEDDYNFELLTKLVEATKQTTENWNNRFYVNLYGDIDHKFIHHMQPWVPSLKKHVDYVNLVTFNYYKLTSTVSLNAPLEGEKPYDSHYNVQETVRAYQALGWPHQKMVLGIPAFAIKWRNVEGRLYEKVHTRPTHIPEVTPTQVENYLHQGYKLYKTSGVPFLASESHNEVISFEDEESVELKAKYAAIHKLAGVFLYKSQNELPRTSERQHERSLIYAAKKGLETKQHLYYNKHEKKEKQATKTWEKKLYDDDTDEDSTRDDDDDSNNYRPNRETHSKRFDEDNSENDDDVYPNSYHPTRRTHLRRFDEDNSENDDDDYPNSYHPTRRTHLRRFDEDNSEDDDVYSNSYRPNRRTHLRRFDENDDL